MCGCVWCCVCVCSNQWTIPSWYFRHLDRIVGTRRTTAPVYTHFWSVFDCARAPATYKYFAFECLGPDFDSEHCDSNTLIVQTHQSHFKLKYSSVQVFTEQYTGNWLWHFGWLRFFPRSFIDATFPVWLLCLIFFLIQSDTAWTAPQTQRNYNIKNYLFPIRVSCGPICVHTIQWLFSLFTFVWVFDEKKTNKQNINTEAFEKRADIL